MLSLAQELRTYEAALPDRLKAADGQYVVIRGQEICQLLPTYESALEWAYEHLGLTTFFVKQVNAAEPVAHFSRDIGLCGR